MRAFLTHPLTLIVVGAFLSSFLIPSFTRRWQNHQKELEIKVDLLGRVSDAVTRVITHAWFRDFGGKEELSEVDRREFDWRYGEWEVNIRVLQANFEAYFRGAPEITAHWIVYTKMLQKLHNLSWEPMGRDRLLEELRTLYESPQLWQIRTPRWHLIPIGSRTFPASTKIAAGEIEWHAFINTEDADSYMGEWATLKAAMEGPLVPLTRAIVGTRIWSF